MCVGVGVCVGVGCVCVCVCVCGCRGVCVSVCRGKDELIRGEAYLASLIVQELPFEH